MAKRKSLDFDSWLMLLAGLAVIGAGVMGLLLAVVAGGGPVGALFLGAMSVMAVVFGGVIAVDVICDKVWRVEG